MKTVETKLRAGKYKIPVKLEIDGERIFFHFRYNADLIDEIKTAFEGRKYHGFDDVKPRKIWSVPITQRNIFQLQYLQGNNPFSRYEQNPDYETVDRLNARHLYSHQREMVSHGLVARQFIWAAEMGTGKTLAAIVLMELSGLKEWVWVGPKSALRAVKLEMLKWDCKLQPTFLTYEGLKKYIAQWPAGQIAPEGVIFDESVKLKTPTAQRSRAGRHLANAIREDHKDKGIIGLLSGAPAPKSPADFWHQCEIACPGFLREKDLATFRQSLGVFSKEDGPMGSYYKLETWLDDEEKCKHCGRLRVAHDGDCKFESSVNEVARLYRRMKGLVLVKMKKDCLDLPEKVYEVIEAEPTEEILNSAKIITRTATRAIEALTLLRELSDGFQYRETVVGKERCPRCNGSGHATEYFDPKDPDFSADISTVERGVRYIYNDDYEVIGEEPVTYEQREVLCPYCQGTGEAEKKDRTILEVPTPKDDILLEQLDLHRDVGRLNIYAGFTASVDRIIKICTKQEWGTIRADGRGWQGFSSKGTPLPNDKLLEIYASGEDNLAFVAQAGAAGMGLTLTASPTTFFYSNTFNADDRLQAEDRGHRIGMDLERGGRIVDVIHLPTDKMILDNLQKKRDLQHMALTGLSKCLNKKFQ